MPPQTSQIPPLPLGVARRDQPKPHPPLPPLAPVDEQHLSSITATRLAGPAASHQAPRLDMYSQSRPLRNRGIKKSSLENLSQTLRNEAYPPRALPDPLPKKRATAGEGDAMATPVAATSASTCRACSARLDRHDGSAKARAAVPDRAPGPVEGRGLDPCERRSHYLDLRHRRGRQPSTVAVGRLP